MFQQTIQDLFAITEAGAEPSSILGRLRERITSFEKVECGEVLVATEGGLARHVFSGGLGETAVLALEALGAEPTLRFDTAAQMLQAQIQPPDGLNSLLVLRLEAPGVSTAALLLGHSRPWSFPATPLSRARALGSMALRLLLTHQAKTQNRDGDETSALVAEVARLRAHSASLESEILALRDHAKKRSGKPR